MASTFSDYKFELIGTGEQSGTWGNTTNTNIGTAIEQAIGGKADVTLSSTSTTLTLTDTNTAQDARALYLNLTGTPGGAATLNVPAIEKAYIVRNGTTGGFAVTVKVTGQTGVSVPNGKTMHLYNNGTDVVNAVNNLPSGSTINNVAIGTGDVSGPASSTDNGIAVFNGTGGKTLKDGGSNNATINGISFGKNSGNNINIGNSNTVASASGSITIGSSNSLNTAANSLVIGDSNNLINANGVLCLSISGSTLATATDCISFGKSITANSAARSIIIGNSALVTGASDAIVIGNSNQASGDDFSITIGNSISSVDDDYFTFGKSGNVVYNQFTVNNSWTQASDVRLKRNVQDDTLGLSFIMKLRPVTFQWKPSNEVPKELTSHHFEENKKDLKATMNGFIAQDVKQALDEVGAGTQGIWSKQKDGTQALSREMFIMPLVNAVKELKAELDAVKAELAALKG